MADRSLVYRVQINTSQAKGEAKQFAAQIKAELSNIKITALDSRMFAGADKQIAKIRTELQSLSQIQAPKVAVDTSGLQQAAQQADNLEKQLREAETQAKRTSAAVKQTSTAQNQKPSPATGGGAGLVAGIGGQLLGIAGISASIAGVVSLGNELATLRKESLLATTAFNTLSGGASQASARLSAMKAAAGGTLTTMEALRSANQITALGMASTAEGFGRITTAARAVTFVSPVIHDIGSAITELSLASANLSFRRLDQLGLSVTEVKAKMDELQEANSGLSDNQAFLEASVSTLISKFGGLTSSAAAQATGVDKLRVSWEEFRRELAEGKPGELADAALQSSSEFIDTFSTFIGSGGGDTIQRALEAQVKRQIANAEFLESLPKAKELGLGATARDSAKDLDLAAKIQKQANEAVAAGVPGAANYAAQIEEITRSISRWGYASDEQEQKLRLLSASLTNAQPVLTTFGDGVANTGAAEQAAAAQAEALIQARKDLRDAAGKKGIDIAGDVGFDRARDIVKQQLTQIDNLIKDFENRGLKGIELDIAVSLAADNIDSDIDAILADSQAKMERLFAGGISSTIGRGIAQLNSEVVDASPALTDVRDRMIELQAEMALTGTATAEQAQEYQNLLSISDAVASSTSVYAALQGEAGESLLTSNSYASALAENIVALDAAQAQGVISAGEHAGALYALVSALIAAAEQAGITGSALAGLQAIQAGLDTSLPGFARGQVIGNSAVTSQKAQEDARLRAEARKAAERAAREQEQAAKRAARELEQGAKRARKDLEQALQGVEGLFGTSKVTQKDLDFAAAGGSVNFADDFVRRFRDLVENGVLHDGAGVEQAKQALQNIGIQPAEDLKLLLGQLEEAWNNSSLFANKENLSLINADAVQQSLDLQEKMKQGRENIMEFFGVAIDDATGAVTSVEADPTGGEELKTAVSDGKQKIIDHLTGATNDAVSAATASVVTGANGGTVGTKATGTAQISAVSIAPEALVNLFANVDVPAITIDKIEIGDSVTQGIVTALSTQIATNAAQLGTQGGTLAISIREGFLAYWIAEGSGTTMATAIRVATASQILGLRESFATQGEEVANAIKDGFTAAWIANGQGADLIGSFLNAYVSQKRANINLVIEEGLILANAIMAGYVGRFTEAAGETTLADAFRNTFGIQVQAIRDRLISSGNEAADIIQEGFVAHWAGGGKAVGGGNPGGAQGGLASAIVDALSTQLATSSDRLDALGGGVANFIMLGMVTYDFSSVGGGLIGQLESSLKSETSMERLTTVGGHVADALFNGFNAQVGQADWLGAIVAAVIASLNAGVQQTQ